MTIEFFRPLFATHTAEVRHDTTVDDAGEWILRAVLSLVTVAGPKRRRRPALDAYLTHNLLPAMTAASEVG